MKRRTWNLLGCRNSKSVISATPFPMPLSIGSAPGRLPATPTVRNETRLVAVAGATDEVEKLFHREYMVLRASGIGDEHVCRRVLTTQRYDFVDFIRRISGQELPITMRSRAVVRVWRAPVWSHNIRCGRDISLSVRPALPRHPPCSLACLARVDS